MKKTLPLDHWAWFELRQDKAATSPDFERTDRVATKRPRKCPMCGVMHHWPTEDKLCYYCEGEWVKRANWYGV